MAEYPQNSVFPAALTVDPNKLYTFAVFGKNGSDIDYSPTVTAQLQLQVWPTSSPSAETTGYRSNAGCNAITVEPLNNGHTGARHFVLYRDIFLPSEVKKLY